MGNQCVLLSNGEYWKILKVFERRNYEDPTTTIGSIREIFKVMQISKSTSEIETQQQMHNTTKNVRNFFCQQYENMRLFGGSLIIPLEMAKISHSSISRQCLILTKSDIRTFLMIKKYE